MGAFYNLPDHAIFKGVTKIFLKEISTIKLSKKAIPVLNQKDQVIMASSHYGKGFVFAVGDPWLYNEYIDNRKLPQGFNNYKAAENLFEWLLSKTNRNK
jgi:unsaturated rhamnogalacturonyl hydrolase